MSRPLSETTFSAADLAELLGLTPRHVARLAADGVFAKVARGRYPASAVAAYCTLLRSDARRGPADFAAERARLTRAKADLAEMELQRQQGQLLDRDEVTAAVVHDLTIIRNRLLAIPPKVAAYLLNITEPRVADATVRKAIHEALEELSAGPAIERAAEETKRK